MTLYLEDTWAHAIFGRFCFHLAWGEGWDGIVLQRPLLDRLFRVQRFKEGRLRAIERGLFPFFSVTKRRYDNVKRLAAVVAWRPRSDGSDALVGPVCLWPERSRHELGRKVGLPEDLSADDFAIIHAAVGLVDAGVHPARSLAGLWSDLELEAARTGLDEQG